MDGAELIALTKIDHGSASMSLLARERKPGKEKERERERQRQREREREREREICSTIRQTEGTSRLLALKYCLSVLRKQLNSQLIASVGNAPNGHTLALIPERT